MHLLIQAIWGLIWKYKVEVSQTNAASVTRHLPKQAVWGLIWKDTVEKSQTNATSVIIVVDFYYVLCWILIILALVGGRPCPCHSLAGFHPALFSDGGHNQRGLGGWLPYLFWRGGFFVWSSFRNFQTIFSFESRITMVTLECIALLLDGFQSCCSCSFRWGPLEVFLSALGISSDRWWAALFLILVGKVSLPPLVSREKVKVESERELEHLALTCQCLAEVQALGGQGGVSHAHVLNFSYCHDGGI